MYPCPEHFIVRPGITGHGEAIVPLIAVDQLPDWMQLVGVPRELDVEQAGGLVNLGFVACEGETTYEVRLHSDKIRAIMSVKDEGGKEESLAPSDSVSSMEKNVEEDEAQERSLAPLTQEDRIKTEKTHPKVPEGIQEQLDFLTEAPEKMAQIAKTTPTLRVPKTRAWGDKSDTASPDTFPADLATPVKPQGGEKHKGQEKDKQTEPIQEHGLSASRHNTANDTNEDNPIRKDKDIRPHLTEEIQDARARRPVIPRIKDRFFGMNPDTIYCRHWCHHGTCKWGWGCRYQHRMPSNQEGLREVGLKDFPTWYLLMMAGGGFPGTPGVGAGPGVNHSMGLHGGINMSMNMNSTNLAMPGHNNFFPGLGRSRHPADALLNTSSRPQHAQQDLSPMDLRLIQGRMSALLAGSTAMSNRQKLRQIKEMRELFLRSNTLPQPANTQAHSLPVHGYASLIGMGNYGLHQGRANLHTNASLAANAAGLSAASRRQAVREAERGANSPVEIPAEEDGRKRDKPGSYDELYGRLTPVGSDADCGNARKETAVREGKLVDIE